MAIIRGTGGAETLSGTSGTDSIYGGDGDDILRGNGGSDLLEGEAGSESLFGGPGRDTLAGGPGGDTLTGGAGADVFLFRAVDDSASLRDTIAGFDTPGATAGDLIDLSLIDADTTTPGKQDLRWGAADDLGTGVVRATDSGDVTVVSVNVDNDTSPELTIAIGDGAVQASAYSAADFALAPSRWTFLSMPDTFNADYGDLSGGADPAIAAVFGSGYASGLVRAPGWTPGGANSMNVELAEVWKANVDRMVASAGGSPQAVLIAGDLVGGHWPQHPASLKAMFGSSTSTLNQDLDTAAAVYDTWQRKMWSLAGVNTVIAAIGDHDIGDNPWEVGSPAGKSVNAMKRAFGAHMVDPLNLPATWNGVPTHPTGGTGEYDEGNYVQQVKDVLFVTLDVFHYNNGAAVEGTSAVSIDFSGAELTWLSKVLTAADADSTVDHVIVQGHTPILYPVDKIRSSNLHLEGGSDSALWQLMAEHGTNNGGKVRAYLAGEVHVTTTKSDADSGIVQISHGVNSQAMGKVQLDPTYIAFSVSKGAIVGTEYTIVNDITANHSVFEVDNPASTTVDTIGRGPVPIGTITIDVSGGSAHTTTTGDFVPSTVNPNFIGTPGNDTASNFRHGFGQGGDDHLNGLAGNDRIDGGPGNDVLTGGTGDDILIGGPGSDRFVYASASGNDTIVDLTPGTDRIAIPGESFAALSVHAASDGTLIEFDRGTITLFGIEPGQVNAGLFDFA
ncbi:MAG: hypothetical protein U1E59_12505 [Amaricoccus sp.]